MRIAITGAEGVIGTVLRRGLATRFELRSLTRTSCAFQSTVVDVTDLTALRAAFAGVDAVVHLAAAAHLDASWEDVLRNNIEGTRQVFEAARINEVRRVVFASSGHVLGLAEERAGATLYALNDTRGFDEHTPAAPDSAYAVSKLFGENLGRLYAETHGLSVICVRFGTVLPDDNPRSEQAGHGRSATLSPAERYVRIRAKWLSHRDCCQLVAKSLTAAAVPYAVVFGTSNNPRQIWSLTSARRLLAYAPEDSAPVS